MRHRLFILLLAGTLILSTAALQNTAQATPFAGGTVLGSIPLWELRAAIPFGIFCAGLFVALVGMAAQLLHSCLLSAGRGDTCTSHCAGKTATAALWSGWPFVACCMGTLLYIVPEYFIPEAAAAQPNHLSTLQPLLTYQLYTGIGLMVLCRIAELFFPGRRFTGIFCLLPVILTLLSTDLFWGGGRGFLLLIAAGCTAVPALVCRGLGGRLIGGLMLLTAAAAFAAVLQPRNSGGVFPVGTADYVCYGISLAVLSGLFAFKFVELSHGKHP